ncbi:MAG: NAD(+) diphosphatase [Ahrensia sp.]|nr:NAD(+) diphosphatase [Ahrensia sp.]
MIRPFIDPAFNPQERGATLAFGGNRLDRLSEERSDDGVERALETTQTRLIGITQGRTLVRLEDQQMCSLMRLSEIEPYAPKLDRAVLLGFQDEAPRLAVPLGLDPQDQALTLPQDIKLIDFRSLAAQGTLDGEELGVVAQGAATLAWHSAALYCGRCGGPTIMGGGGVKRVCTSCGRESFPRTDAVVIMLTISGDRCLLGRSPHFPPGMYSALAGFIEAGESIEMAVRRETFEESGIRVGAVRYHASQPWPFPHSLMIGCYGEALETGIDADMDELEDCRWFSRDEILAVMQGNGPKQADGSPALFIPPPMAIANRLITDWVKEVVKGEP